MILEQSDAQFDHNYLVAKEFAGWPRVAHHATARKAMDEVRYGKIVAAYRASASYTTITLARTSKILPRHSIPPSSGL